MNYRMDIKSAFYFNFYIFTSSGLNTKHKIKKKYLYINMMTLTVFHNAGVAPPMRLQPELFIL